MTFAFTDAFPYGMACIFGICLVGRMSKLPGWISICHAVLVVAVPEDETWWLSWLMLQFTGLCLMNYFVSTFSVFLEPKVPGEKFVRSSK